MDLSSVKPAEIEVEIVHPGTGEKLGLVLRCVSPQDASAGPARRLLAERSQRKRGVGDDDAIEFLAALVRGWSWGDADWNGVKLDFTPANVRTVLREPWIRIQVDQAIADDRAFFI